jgi:hypothetical protein
MVTTCDAVRHPHPGWRVENSHIRSPIVIAWGRSFRFDHFIIVALIVFIVAKV